jgi:hypothetical protein
MAKVNTLGLTSKFPINTIFVTDEVQTTVHTQPVHIDMTHWRTEFHTHSSSCTVVTAFRPEATENVCMAPCCYVPSHKDITLKFATNLTMIHHRTLCRYSKSTRRSYLAISRVGHVVISQNTVLLQNMSSIWPPMAYRLHRLSGKPVHCFGICN